MKRLTLAAALVAAATLTAGTVQAQTCNTDATTMNPAATAICTVNVSATATVNDVMRLTLGSTTQDLGTPAEADYIAGFKTATGTTTTVKSNRPWKVTVAAASAFGYNANGSGLTRGTPKAAADILWGTDGSTYGNDMGTSAQLDNGNGTAGSAPKTIYYKTLWAWATDVPGIYTVTLNFTLSTP